MTLPGDPAVLVCVPEGDCSIVRDMASIPTSGGGGHDFERLALDVVVRRFISNAERGVSVRRRSVRVRRGVSDDVMVASPAYDVPVSGEWLRAPHRNAFAMHEASCSYLSLSRDSLLCRAALFYACDGVVPCGLFVSIG